MTCLTTERKTDLEADLVAVLANITLLDAAITGFALTGTRSYTFDSGTGKAQEVFNSPLEMITARERLIAQRNYLRRALDGTTLLRQQTRRQ